jgi:GT2 family glycosyltransferase
MFYFPHDRTLAVDVIVGCFSMIRREAFDEVGLLDEDLFMYGDDVDWCRRARNAGWQVVFYPGGHAIHDRGKTTASFPVHFAVAQQRSVLRYWTKHHTILGVLGIRGIMLFHHLMRYMVADLSSLANSRRRPQNEVRMQVSGACIRQLLYGSVPKKPEEQLAS